MYPHLDSQKIEDMVHQIISNADMNGSGLIDYTEYLVSAIQKEKLVTKERLLKAFQTFDLVALCNQERGRLNNKRRMGESLRGYEAQR